MKKIVLTLLAASVVAISCNSNTAKNTETDSTANATAVAEGNATISFEKNNYDFGKITETEKVTHEFKFINNGTEPLIISSATATCGCTVPEYPKEPVAPGESGVIKVVYDSKGQPGMQHKVVTVTANTTPTATELYLTGEVKPKENNN
ncbi:MAG: DUF1573 domain-containing protein [Sphingobacteriaceae bacterium]